MMRISRRDRRAVVLAAGVVLATVGVGRWLPRWKSWRNDERDRAWQAEARLERLRAVGRARVQLATSVAIASKAYLALAPRLVDGDNAATGGASLLAMVSNAAIGSGLEVGSLQSSGDSVGRRFVRVAVRGEATGDVRGLATFLETLETGPVITGIRELSVDQPEPGAPNEQSEALRINFVVDGIVLRRARAK